MAVNDMLVNAATIASTASDAAPTTSALAATALAAWSAVAADIQLGGTDSVSLNTAQNNVAKYLARFLSITANNQLLTVTRIETTNTGAAAATAPFRSGAVTQPAAVGVGTLTNAPKAGDPPKWMPIDINGTVHFFPCWAI